MREFSSLRDWNTMWEEFDALFRVPASTVNYAGEDKGDRLELSVEMPGVKKEDVKVTFENKILSVSAERGERKYNQGYRISHNIDASKITAKLEDGILLVTIPKSESSNQTEIKVE